MELFGIDGLGWLIRLILGLLIGFCIGLTSIGGGVLVLPALTVLLRLDPLVAVGTTTLYAFLTKITALFHHLHLKTINWSISRPFLIGAIPATCISAGWISLKGADELFKAQLEKFIIGIIFLGIALIIWNMCSHKKESEHTSIIARYLQAHKAAHTLSALLFGALCGGLVGATPSAEVY